MMADVEKGRKADEQVMHHGLSQQAYATLSYKALSCTKQRPEQLHAKHYHAPSKGLSNFMQSSAGEDEAAMGT